MLDKLFAVCLLVEDVERAAKFYREVLGLKVEDENGKFISFKAGEVSVAMFEKSEAVAMLPKKYMGVGGGAVLAFQVGDVGHSCKQLSERGVEIVEGPKVTAWGQKVAYFLDPDGNIIEISEG